MSEGLGMRYAFIGPMETMHLNAPKGKFPGLYSLVTYKNTNSGYFLTEFKILWAWILYSWTKELMMCLFCSILTAKSFIFTKKPFFIREKEFIKCLFMKRKVSFIQHSFNCAVSSFNSANQSECTSHVCCGKLLELTKAQAFEHQRLQ